PEGDVKEQISQVRYYRTRLPHRYPDCRLPAHLADPAADGGHRISHDLHRNRKMVAQPLAELRGLCNDQEPTGRIRNDLLLQERAAAALDHVPRRVYLIRAVDREIQRAFDDGVIECEDLDAQRPGLELGLEARDDRPYAPQASLRDAGSHPAGGPYGRGAGSKPQPHAVLYETVNGLGPERLLDGLDVPHVYLSFANIPKQRIL